MLILLFKDAIELRTAEIGGPSVILYSSDEAWVLGVRFQVLAKDENRIKKN
jgi:hypothetical protein